jgi:hypothetical protein
MEHIQNKIIFSIFNTLLYLAGGVIYYGKFFTFITRYIECVTLFDRVLQKSLSRVSQENLRFKMWISRVEFVEVVAEKWNYRNSIYITLFSRWNYNGGKFWTISRGNVERSPLRWSYRRRMQYRVLSGDEMCYFGASWLDGPDSGETST